MRLGLSLSSPPASLAAVAGEAPLTSPSSHSDAGIVSHLGPGNQASGRDSGDGGTGSRCLGGHPVHPTVSGLDCLPPEEGAHPKPRPGQLGEGEDGATVGTSEPGGFLPALPQHPLQAWASPRPAACLFLRL